jgi:hypothetical protein
MKPKDDGGSDACTRGEGRRAVIVDVVARAGRAGEVVGPRREGHRDTRRG